MADGFFSEDKVAEVRGRSNIVEVVSDYVSLKKTGKNYKGLCPFHSEKTPSFMVNEEKQIFHCFGCGEGGDVFTFLMKMGHFTFPQALEELAKRYGIRLSFEPRSPARKREMARKEALLQINQIAMSYFHDLLMGRREGEPGRRYLNQRGVSKVLLEDYRLGFSLEGWNGLVNHLREKKIDLPMGHELGLILPRKREGWYDAFRGRVIFPIFDIHQRPVGFGGRVLKDEQPKYLNSPESIVYHKGEILYGLHAARQAIAEKDRVILVEGYFDLLSLHQFGLKESVATSGTALTVQHIRILKRYTKNLITLFDSDPAGVQANLRSLPLFLEEDVWGKTVLLPRGEDPDTFLRKGNVEALEHLVTEAPSLFDVYFENLTQRHDPRTIQGKVKIAEEGIGLIRKVPEGIRRSFYLKALAEKVDLPENRLYEILRRSPAETRRPSTDKTSPPEPKSFPKSEEVLVRLMIQFPDVIRRMSEMNAIQEFEDPLLRTMAGVLEEHYQERGDLDLAEVLERFEEDEKRVLCRFAIQEDGLEKGDRDRVLSDCIQNIKERRLRLDRNELLKRIKEAERRCQGEGLESLLLERQELARKERTLRRKPS